MVMGTFSIERAHMICMAQAAFFPALSISLDAVRLFLYTLRLLLADRTNFPILFDYNF